MARKPVSMEKINKKLRNELKTLKSELKVLQKSAVSFCTPKVVQKLIFQTRDKLQLGVFSPAKIPRQKSPMSILSKKPSISPQTTRKNSTLTEAFKENLPIPSEHEFKSPHFPDTKENPNIESSTIQKPDNYVEEIQKLEQENKILRKLHNLRKENQILREKVGLDMEPKHLNSKAKREEIIKKKKSLLGSLELSTSTNLDRKSPLVLENMSCKYLRKRNLKKKSRILGCRHSSIQMPLIQNPTKARSKSVTTKHQHKSSCNFSFTDSVKNSDRVSLKNKDFSKSLGVPNEIIPEHAFGLLNKDL